MEEILAAAYHFWDRLTGDERERLLKSCAVVTYGKGDQIHRSDMGCKGAILLLSGLLRVYILSDEGREVTLFRIHAGESCVLSASCLLDSIQFDVIIEAAEAMAQVERKAGFLKGMRAGARLVLKLLGEEEEIR